MKDLYERFVDGFFEVIYAGFCLVAGWFGFEECPVTSPFSQPSERKASP